MSILGPGFRHSNINTGGQTYTEGEGIDITNGVISNTGLVSIDDIPDADGTNTRGLISNDMNQVQYLAPKIHMISEFTYEQIVRDSGTVGTVLNNDGTLNEKSFNNYIQIMTDNAGFGSFAIANADTVKLLSVMYDDPGSFSIPYNLPRRIDRSNTTEIHIQIPDYVEVTGTLVNCTIAY